MEVLFASVYIFFKDTSQETYKKSKTIFLWGSQFNKTTNCSFLFVSEYFYQQNTRADSFKVGDQKNSSLRVTSENGILMQFCPLLSLNIRANRECVCCINISSRLH